MVLVSVAIVPLGVTTAGTATGVTFNPGLAKDVVVFVRTFPLGSLVVVLTVPLE